MLNLIVLYVLANDEQGCLLLINFRPSLNSMLKLIDGIKRLIYVMFYFIILMLLITQGNLLGVFQVEY